IARAALARPAPIAAAASAPVAPGSNSSSESSGSFTLSLVALTRLRLSAGVDPLAGSSLDKVGALQERAIAARPTGPPATDLAQTCRRTHPARRRREPSQSHRLRPERQG